MPDESRESPREPSTTFESLLVWQDAHAFVLEVYRVTALLPSSQRFGLASQFQRASVSIAANIAEGYRRPTIPDKRRLFSISDASIDECRYYCILCRDLGYPTPENWQENLSRIQARLVKYMTNLSVEPKSVRKT